MKHITLVLIFSLAHVASANNCTIYPSRGGLESRDTKTLAECASRAVTVLGTEDRVGGKLFSKMDPIKGKFVFNDLQVSVLFKPMKKNTHIIKTTQGELKH